MILVEAGAGEEWDSRIGWPELAQRAVLSAVESSRHAALKTGDRVVTASGIHGMISNVKDRSVIVKVADNVKLEMEKSAITNVVKAEA